MTSKRVNSAREWLGEQGGTRPRVFLTLILLAALSGIAVAALPPFVFTLALALVVMLLVLAQPMAGIVAILAMLYFPLLPNVTLGSFEFSASAFPILGVGVAALMSTRSRHYDPLPTGWQWILLLTLAGSFAFSTVMSSAYGVTIPILPNLGLYLVILFAMMALIDSPRKLALVAKVILVLAFVLSIWRVELDPLRRFLGLPSLGINEAIFAFHPAVALGLVIILIPSCHFSMGWRYFAGVSLLSFVLHGVTYQGRAGLLTWGLMVLIFLSRVSVKRSLLLIAALVLVSAAIAYQYQDLIKQNITDAHAAAEAAASGDKDLATTSGDRLRIITQAAALQMFETRPIFGWGPNLYAVTSRSFMTPEDRKWLHQVGPFDAWLQVLAEKGIVGLIPSLAVFLVPLFLVWRSLAAQDDGTRLLAFGFALGAIGLALHLAFIDLLFSFAWIHAGVALAAARLSLAESSSGG